MARRGSQLLIACGLFPMLVEADCVIYWQRICTSSQVSSGKMFMRFEGCAAPHRYIMQTYVRPNMVFTHGEGARLYDAHGREYLDFAAGIAVNALGT